MAKIGVSSLAVTKANAKLKVADKKKVTAINTIKQIFFTNYNYISTSKMSF